MICKNCIYRRDKGFDEHERETNKGPKCWLGYTQNPSTLKGVHNVLSNGGEVCRNLRKS